MPRKLPPRFFIYLGKRLVPYLLDEILSDGMENVQHHKGLVALKKT